MANRFQLPARSPWNQQTQSQNCISLGRGGGAIGWVVFLWFWVAWLGGGVETCTSATPRDARQLISNQSAVIAGEENETRN